MPLRVIWDEYVRINPYLAGLDTSKRSNLLTCARRVIPVSGASSRQERLCFGSGDGRVGDLRGGPPAAATTGDTLRIRRRPPVGLQPQGKQTLTTVGTVFDRCTMRVLC